MSDRQYRFQDDQWVDVWNDIWDEQTHPDPEHDWAEAILMDGFCGCGSPDRVVELARQMLGTADPIMIVDDSMEQLLMAYWLDHVGLIEHGSSIYVSWLTDAGRRWIELRDTRSSD